MASYLQLRQLPSNVDPFPITRQTFAFKSLWAFDKWQGIACVRILYNLALCLWTFLALISFIASFGSGVGGIIGALILIPIMWMLFMLITRIVCELMASLLLLPHLLGNVPAASPAGGAVANAPTMVSMGNDGL